MFKKLISEYVPFLGKYKRYIVAVADSLLPLKESYSQNREDFYIWNLLKEYDLEGSIYVDIGANHPSDISNTYLLYRHGLQGIIIEPNRELIDLYPKFRKRDIPLALGCSNVSSVLKLHVSKTPVLSTFKPNERIKPYRTVYVPVMTLDEILSHVELTFINFLNIDVEGLGYEVLAGARNSIKKALFVCIEYESEKQKEHFSEVFGSDFELLKVIGCNLIYKNKLLSHRYLKYKENSK